MISIEASPQQAQPESTFEGAGRGEVVTGTYLFGNPTLLNLVTLILNPTP